MPNNAKLFGTTHLTCWSCLWSISCIKMTCHHECAFHMMFCYLCCSLSGVVCASVDRGVEVQPKFFDDSCYLTFQQGKRKSPSLSISLILCFPTSILSTIILHTIPCLCKLLEYPTSCINFIHPTGFPPNIHRIDVLAWVSLCLLLYICLDLLSSCLMSVGYLWWWWMMMMMMVKWMPGVL